MRFGLITHWYDPEGGAAAGPGVIARSLRDHGHDVHVLTGFPTYPDGVLFPGVRMRPYVREQFDGISVHRTAVYPSHDHRAAHRAANYLSFAVSASAVAPFKFSSVDAVLVYSSPATTAIPALALRRLRGVPYVLHIHDLWPQTVTSSSLLKTGTSGRLESLLHRYCDATYRNATQVAVTSPGMEALLLERGVPQWKIVFVPNWADESVFQPRSRSSRLARELGLPNGFIVMYAGNFGEFQDLNVVVEAAHQLKAHADIHFVLVGGGTRELALRKLVHDLRVDNVTFIPPQPFSRIGDVLALADVQLVTLRDLPLFRSTLPSKLQANMAVAKPVLGMLAGDAASIVEESGCGLVVPPGSATKLAEGVISMRRETGGIQEMGVRGRKHYEAHFSEKVIGDRLSDIMHRTAMQARTGK